MELLVFFIMLAVCCGGRGDASLFFTISCTDRLVCATIVRRLRSGWAARELDAEGASMNDNSRSQRSGLPLDPLTGRAAGDRGRNPATIQAIAR